jgi:hypothetical protein
MPSSGERDAARFIACAPVTYKPRFLKIVLEAIAPQKATSYTY